MKKMIEMEADFFSTAEVREFEEFFKKSMKLFCVLSRSGDIEYINSAGKRWLTQDGQKPLPKNFLIWLHPEDRDQFAEHLRTLSEKTPSLKYPCRTTGPDDRNYWAEWCLGLSCGRIFLMGHDITEAKEREHTLHQKSLQLENMVQNAPGMVYQFQLNPDGQMFLPYASAKAMTLYEIEESDYLKNPSIMLEYVHPDDKEELNRLILESAELMTPFEWVGRLKTRTGKVKWMKAQSIPTKLENGAILWDGLMIDISKERQKEMDLEQQMLAAQHHSRLASVGLLAAGVGHEINNPLTVVMGKIWSIEREIQKDAPDRSEIQKSVERLKVATSKIQKIVDGLRIFTRMGRTEEQVTDLNTTIGQVLMLLDEIFAKENLEIRYEPDQIELKVACNAGQLQQVLMNLISNARDASQEREKKFIQIHIETNGSKQVFIEIEDNGIGISTEVQKMLFEPFFTTKDVGQGTGLGLSISRSLAQSWGGDLKLKWSKPGKGSCFQISVPVASKSQKISRPLAFDVHSTEALKLNQDKNISVLVVDDEEGVRELLNEICREAGARVFEAGDGEEALEILEREKTVDLVITDLKMPRRDGHSLIAEIRERFPKNPPRLYLISGGVLSDISQNASGADGFLVKPFEPFQIADLVKETSSAKAARTNSKLRQ